MRITYDFGLVGEVSFGTSVPVFGTLAKPAIAVPCFDGLERGIVLPWGLYSLFCDVGAASVYASEHGVSIAGMVFVSYDWAMFVSDFRDSVLGVRGFSEGRATRPWRRRDVIYAAQCAFDGDVSFHEARCARFAIAFLCNLSMCFAPVSMKDVSSDVGVLDRYVPVLESFMKHRYDLALSACVVGEDAASELSRYLSFGYALFVCFDAGALVPDADGELFSLGGRHAAVVVKVQDSVVFCDQHGSRVLADDCVTVVLGGVSREHVVVGVRRRDVMGVRDFVSLVRGTEDVDLIDVVDMSLVSDERGSLSYDVVTSSSSVSTDILRDTFVSDVKSFLDNNAFFFSDERLARSSADGTSRVLDVVEPAKQAEFEFSKTPIDVDFDFSGSDGRDGIDFDPFS